MGDDACVVAEGTRIERTPLPAITDPRHRRRVVFPAGGGPSRVATAPPLLVRRGRGARTRGSFLCLPPVV